MKNIEDLGFSRRVLNLLQKQMNFTTEVLCENSRDELVSLRHFGEKTVQEIERVLLRNDLKLKEEQVPETKDLSQEDAKIPIGDFKFSP
jgi:DNA-directed RNA polymerase alpha subunit